MKCTDNLRFDGIINYLKFINKMYINLKQIKKIWEKLTENNRMDFNWKMQKLLFRKQKSNARIIWEIPYLVIVLVKKKHSRNVNGCKLIISHQYDEVAKKQMQF